MLDFLYQSSSLKGQGHEMNIFEGIKIKKVNKSKVTACVFENIC
jgi:hypothetical protein